MNGSRIFAVGMMAAVLAPAHPGGEVNRSWDTLVSELKPGRRVVVVVQHSGRRAEGKVVSLTSESITVEMGAQPSPIRREDVFRVRAAGIRSRNALIGFGIGAAAGVVLGINLGSRRHGLSAAVFGGVFGGAGAAAGSALPIGDPIYEAPGGLRKAGP